MTTHTYQRRYEVEWFDPYDGERSCRQFNDEADARAYWLDLPPTWLPNMRTLAEKLNPEAMSR
jgi:hypothetical protein